jgi:hypothetical protein
MTNYYLTNYRSTVLTQFYGGSAFYLCLTNVSNCMKYESWFHQVLFILNYKSVATSNVSTMILMHDCGPGYRGPEE